MVREVVGEYIVCRRFPSLLKRLDRQTNRKRRTAVGKLSGARQARLSRRGRGGDKEEEAMKKKEHCRDVVFTSIRTRYLFVC